MKILFLSHKFYPDIGGIETHSELMAKAFFKAGHEIHLITWTKNPGSITFPYQIIRSPDFKRIIKECLWSDLVFENNICLRLSWPILFFHRPLMIVLQTWLTRTDGQRGLQDLVKHNWLKRANVVISCSDSIRKKCWPASVVINNSYNEELFRILPGIARTVDFVFLGRLVSDKGADTAIHAIYELKKLAKKEGLEAMTVTLTIIGEGPERTALENLVLALRLGNQVDFKGALRGNALVECLNQHRYIIVPSKWNEPFGIVALEGMACGCIPIVSDGGGLPDAVGNAGLTFTNGDVNALITCIKGVLCNQELQLKLREEAKAHLRQHHSGIIARQYLKKIEVASKYQKIKEK